MLYQQKVFTLPASSGASTSQKNWDRSFLTKEQFESIYGIGEYWSTSPESVPDATGCSE